MLLPMLVPISPASDQGPFPIECLDAAFEIINMTHVVNWDTVVAMKTNQNAASLKLATMTWKAVQYCLLLAAGLALSACKQEAKVTTGQEAKVATGNDFSGVYTLVTVNGNKMPATVSHDGTALQVRSGTFTINTDGTCSSKVIFVPPSGAEATREVSATYTREGQTLNMQWKGAGKTVGTIEGNTFTMNNEGMVFAYKK